MPVIGVETYIRMTAYDAVDGSHHLNLSATLQYCVTHCERLLLAEGVEEVGFWANFGYPLIEGADISLPPRFLPRRFGVIGS